VGIKKAGLSLPAKEQTELIIGFYNADKATAEEATLIIDECKSSSSGDISSYAVDGAYPVKVVASAEDVSPSTEVGFYASLKNNNLVSGETYICKLKVVMESDATVEYETLTFFLNVIS